MQRWMAAAATTALILASGSAFARSINDSSAPVDISADEQENINSQCRTIFRGNVEMLQDKSRLRANVVNAYSTKKPGAQAGSNACGEVDHVKADGDVYFVNQDQTVRGDSAVFTYSNDTIVITGNVIVVRGLDVARGDRMTVNTKTNDVKLESNAKGRGKTGRVRSVIYPEKSQTPAPATR